MHPLFKRVLSAIALIFMMLFTSWKFGVWGLLILGLAICTLGVTEFSALNFRQPNCPRAFPVWFSALAIAQLVTLTVVGFDYYFLILVYIPIFLAGGLWIFNTNSDNQNLYNLLARGAFGFFYIASLPAFGLRLLVLDDQGVFWFSFLLLTVFAGDTFAYFGGKTIKGPKLMPQISPNKTVSGAASGIVGSNVAGAALAYYYMPSLPLWFLVLICSLVGVVAQCGDLFESLMKRVAEVKDSGHFMPGHGGVLDRIDGAIMAAPIVYAASFTYSAGWIARL